jgi:hypothetical protein
MTVPSSFSPSSCAILIDACILGRNETDDMVPVHLFEGKRERGPRAFGCVTEQTAVRARFRNCEKQQREIWALRDAMPF